MFWWERRYSELCSGPVAGTTVLGWQCVRCVSGWHKDILYQPHWEPYMILFHKYIMEGQTMYLQYLNLLISIIDYVFLLDEPLNRCFSLPHHSGDSNHIPSGNQTWLAGHSPIEFDDFPSLKPSIEFGDFSYFPQLFSYDGPIQNHHGFSGDFPAVFD